MNEIYFRSQQFEKENRPFLLGCLSFSLPDGGIIDFIDVNGSGKTTTIKTILGL